MVPCYGLDSPGIESRWWRDFPYPFSPVLGPSQPPVQWVPGLSLGVRWLRCGVDAFGAEIKKQSRTIPLLSIRAFMACKEGGTINMYISEWRYIRLWFMLNIMLEFSWAFSSGCHNICILKSTFDVTVFICYV
jgi:hypothetical protein